MTELTPDMIAQLSTTGLSSKAVAERLGIGQKAAARLLIATGAKQNDGRYRIQNLARNEAAWRIMEQPACSTGNWKR